MTETPILDDRAIQEIEARLQKADAVVDYDAEPEVIASLHDIPALCAAVKHLWAEVDRGALCEECEQWEYNEDGSVRTFMVCGACWNAQQVKLQLLQKTGLRNAQLIDRIQAWSKCEDSYPLDEHINNITVERERLQLQLEQLRAENERECKDHQLTIDTFRQQEKIWQQKHNEFKTEAVKFCKQKAVEWERIEGAPEEVTHHRGKATAAYELAAKLEKL